MRKKRNGKIEIRIEDPTRVSFITDRTKESRLWFVNNRKLEREILGRLAKAQNERGVKLYAFVMQGNHYHSIAVFPEANRFQFEQDLNAGIQIATTKGVKEFRGGTLWGGRYAEVPLLTNEDIEEKFFYCALQAVHAGLCDNPEDYPGYNSFWDAIEGIEREFTWINYTEYNEARRKGKKVKPEDFLETNILRYDRLPGYEHLSQSEYSALMREKLERRRQKLILERRKEGVGFLGVAALRRVRPGSKPKKTKSGVRRPLCITNCPIARETYLDFYFETLRRFREASKRYRAGDLTAEFPPGTFRPPRPPDVCLVARNG